LFSKQLNKPPKEYAKGEMIPHVKVALDRIKAGEKEQTLVNHIIQYIVCKPKDKSQDSLAKCCFDDKAYERSISNSLSI
jgi:DNA polymerase elongation subunit (family B)